MVILWHHRNIWHTYIRIRHGICQDKSISGHRHQLDQVSGNEIRSASSSPLTPFPTQVVGVAHVCHLYGCVNNWYNCYNDIQLQYVSICYKCEYGAHPILILTPIGTTLAATWVLSELRAPTLFDPLTTSVDLWRMAPFWHGQWLWG